MNGSDTLSTVRNRALFAADLVGWLAIPHVALALRLDSFSGYSTYAPHLAAFTLCGLVLKFSSLWLFGIYRRYWRYASIEELGLIVAAVLASGTAVGLVYALLVAPFSTAVPRLPFSVLVIDCLLTLLFVGGTRFSLRAFEHLAKKRTGGARRERVLIVGAGSAGTMVARELHSNARLEMEPVAFVDDDPAKHGKTICGLSVVGGRDKIANVVEAYGVNKAIIAMPASAGTVVREVQEACRAANLPTKTAPGMFEILSGQVGVSMVRDVQIEDLLRRQPVQIDEQAVAELVRGMTVLVTGAGGSIGSEICRQVAKMGAGELILLGHGENSIFEVHHDLAVRYPGLRLTPVIADIRNGARISRIFETYRPDGVFHAAAHKHVPLMELNPEEAVTNNVLGTSNVLSASEQVGSRHFVFISTDKAVNPANVMGATKLLAEMLVHNAAVRSGADYLSVRFGNVLASRGSVVPLFQKQIAAGGPLTITHPDTARYFMTIPEAVQLVLQAAALGRGGETFVLDMGEPVRIVDLAKDLVHLSGLEVGKDIDLVFTGLRPGEKFFEELFNGDETFKRTAHDKIFVATNGQAPGIPDSRLASLITAASAGDSLRVRQQLAEIVPAYEPPAAEGASGSVAQKVRRRDTGSKAKPERPSAEA
jgi:FlaA1/EpsC-like NDP-sugar epimerase